MQKTTKNEYSGLSNWLLKYEYDRLIKLHQKGIEIKSSENELRRILDQMIKINDEMYKRGI